MGIREEMLELTSARTGRPPRLRRRVVTLEDGHRVGVAVCGEGVPLVFIHGLMAEGMLYARALRRIAGLGFRVVAVDSAGHGSTQGLGERGWRWDAYVDVHRRVIDHLGIRSAVLMGHSMGGRVVVDLAAGDPDRAIAVIPVNAAIGSGFDRFTALSRRLPVLLPLAVGLLGLDSAISMAAGHREMIALSRLAAPSLPFRLRALPSVPQAFLATIGATGSGEKLQSLRDAGVPVVIVHGDRDLIVWYPFARGAARSAGARLVRVRGAHHSWMLEGADSLPAILTALLEAEVGEGLGRAGGTIGELFESGALIHTLDRPQSPPYFLEPRHRWADDPAATSA